MTIVPAKPHATRAHSIMSPSTASRWIACPGSVNLCADLKPVPESKYAAEGTQAHEWAEHMLRNGEVDALERVGLTLDAKVGQQKLTREMAENINVYLDKVYSVLASGAITELYVEERLSLARFFRNGDGDGTGDAIVYDVETQHVHVCDLKYGAGVGVVAEGNAQLQQYALGAVERFKDRGVKTVSIHIIQPRFPGEPVKTWTISRADLFDWSETIVEAIEKTRQLNAPLVAGAHCRWCPAAYWQKCEALRSKALAAAAEGFDAANLESDDATPADPRTMGSEELGRRLREASTLMIYVKVLSEFAEAEARAGRVPSGYKWVESVGHRAWNAPDAKVALEIVETDPDVSPWVRKLKSPAKLETELGKQKFKALVALVKQPRSFAMVSESDRRPAVQYTEGNSDGFTSTEQD